MITGTPWLAVLRTIAVLSVMLAIVVLAMIGLVRTEAGAKEQEDASSNAEPVAGAQEVIEAAARPGPYAVKRWHGTRVGSIPTRYGRHVWNDRRNRWTGFGYRHIRKFGGDPAPGHPWWPRKITRTISVGTVIRIDGTTYVKQKTFTLPGGKIWYRVVYNRGGMSNGKMKGVITAYIHRKKPNGSTPCSFSQSDPQQAKQAEIFC